MKIGVEVSIDVTKIEKARLYQGQKGKYLTMVTFIDIDQKDQYDNNGFIAHKKGQEEQGNAPILGNVKVFWSDAQPQQQQPAQRQQGQSNSQGFQSSGQQFGQQQNTARQQTNQAVQQNVNQGQQNVNMNGAVDFDDDLAF